MTLTPEELTRRVLEGAAAGGRTRAGKGKQTLVKDLLRQTTDIAKVARLAQVTPHYVRRLRRELLKKHGSPGANVRATPAESGHDA